MSHVSAVLQLFIHQGCFSMQRFHWVYKSKSLMNSNLILQLLNKNKASCRICKNCFICKVAFSSKLQSYSNYILLYKKCYLHKLFSPLSISDEQTFISLEIWQNLPFLRKDVYFSFKKYYLVTWVYVTTELFLNFASFFLPL